MRTNRLSVGWLLAVVAVAGPLRAEAPPFLPAATVAALAQETSGETAKRNLERLSREHRMRGSRGFHAAATVRGGGAPALRLRGRARRVDSRRTARSSTARSGRGRPGTPSSRSCGSSTRTAARQSIAPRELGRGADLARAGQRERRGHGGAGGHRRRHRGEPTTRTRTCAASWCSPRRSRGRWRRSRSRSFGAAGIVSYAQNQRTAWWGEDDKLVRWGHPAASTRTKTFAFMVSLKTARALSAAAGRRRAGAAARGGARRARSRAPTRSRPPRFPAPILPRAEEIVFSCHLDHPRPGANDNASGCAAILEVARTLVEAASRRERLAPPRRTIRFVFPPEIEGTLALLNGRPELATRITRRDPSRHGRRRSRDQGDLPRHARTGQPAVVRLRRRRVVGGVRQRRDRPRSPRPARARLAARRAPEGGKEPLQAELGRLQRRAAITRSTATARSASRRSTSTTGRTATSTPPATSPANIDPTKLKRAAFLAAASALVLADCDATNAPALLPTLRAQSLRRLARLAERRVALPAAETGAFVRFWRWHEGEIWASLDRFAGSQLVAAPESSRFLARWGELLGHLSPNEAAADASLVAPSSFAATRRPKGRCPSSATTICARTSIRRSTEASLCRRRAGGDYAYEALNLVDGRRSVQAIRDALTAIYGPVSLGAVASICKHWSGSGSSLQRPRSGRRSPELHLFPPCQKWAP